MADERVRFEPGFREPAPDVDRPIGWAAVARPDDERFGCAQRRECADRSLNVVVGNVAEHAADEHDVRGDGARVHVGFGRVGAYHLDRRGGRRAGARREFGIELDEASAYVARARVLGQHTEQIAAFARAHADGTDQSGRRRVEHVGDRALHDDAWRARGERGVVGRVPGPPVAAHGRRLLPAVVVSGPCTELSNGRPDSSVRRRSRACSRTPSWSSWVVGCTVRTRSARTSARSAASIQSV